MRRWVESLHPPQSPLSLINMEFPIVSLISNMRLQRRFDLLSHGIVHLVLVRQRHGDVVDLQADEGRAGVGAAADVHAVLRQFDEVDDDVEFGQGGATVVVEGGYVCGEGFFGGIVFESAFGVVDVPERHFGGSDWKLRTWG